MRIVIDQGHGAGVAHNRGGLLFNEGDQNFKFGNLLKSELEKYNGVEVFTTRKKNTDNPELKERATMYKNVDLFISTHTNAANSTVRGMEIFVSVKNKGNEKLAKAILLKGVDILKTNNRGIKYKSQNDGRDWFGVLRNSNAKLSMLIEWVFHTNMTDSKVYLDKQGELAKEVAKVIANHYGLSLKQSKSQVGLVSDYNGFKKKGNAYVYFRQSGTQAYEWQKIKGYWYYFRKGTGTMVTGFQWINGRWRYFDGQGRYVDDFVKANKTTPMPFD
ncbi:hypothetical protein GUI37_01715 [Helcococcus kunzii]|uniref:N-acetylmuramoyl-L-alanine amidase family protein n=1 Tax=Helcococcus kunzii TaxID=40091 RepID=UPI001BB0D1CD|nr:N-acetylmuramoyl-L-alanine amidase [Helcococcus kunzii]QUY64302.1 hypothetical protein GUI37_01715 [Helcococcus kunzii]